MGTNFYLFADEKEYAHIGKRSAAGLYCWDCGITLCSSSFKSKLFGANQVFGDEAIHWSVCDWLDSCPLCGKSKTDESLSESSAGRELGFNKSEPKRKSGVSSCCSFSWAISFRHFIDLVNAPNISIRDEYGRVYNRDEFRDVLLECPIKFYDSVNTEFF